MYTQPIIQSICHPNGYYRFLIAVTQLYHIFRITYNNPEKRPPKGSYIGPWLVTQLYDISVSVSLSASKFESVYMCTYQHVAQSLIKSE